LTLAFDGLSSHLLGVARLAHAMQHPWESREFANPQTHEVQTLAELNATERLVAALYSCMNDFSLFVPLSMLYFTAASFSETARRLERPHLAGSFLMHAHPVFGQELASCCEQARKLRELPPCSAQKQEFIKRIRHIIEPFNVAGLGNAERRNWYPVDAADLLSAAPKLGASRQEIEQLLERCGFSCASA
jgi:FADH2 O2-dependent halogenase